MQGQNGLKHAGPSAVLRAVKDGKVDAHRHAKCGRIRIADAGGRSGG